MRHGLWQFHRALKRHERQVRWWDDEADLATRMVSHYTGWWLGGAHVPQEYTKWMQIARCAQRAIRLFNLPRNVQTWNGLCERIGKRIGARPQTMRVVLLGQHRPRTMIVLKDEFTLPDAKWGINEVRERYERLKTFLESTCLRCRKPAVDEVWLNERGMNLCGFAEFYGYPNRYYVPACRKCAAAFRRIAREAADADDTRRVVNRTKLTIARRRAEAHESTQVDA